MATDPNITKKIAAINAGLSAALPTLGMVMELGRMLYDLAKSGPDATRAFEDDIAKIHAMASKLQATSADWFAANPEYDPETGRRR